MASPLVTATTFSPRPLCLAHRGVQSVVLNDYMEQTSWFKSQCYHFNRWVEM